MFFLLALICADGDNPLFIGEGFGSSQILKNCGLWKPCDNPLFIGEGFGSLGIGSPDSSHCSGDNPLFIGEGFGSPFKIYRTSTGCFYVIIPYSSGRGLGEQSISLLRWPTAPVIIPYSSGRGLGEELLGRHSRQRAE